MKSLKLFLYTYSLSLCGLLSHQNTLSLKRKMDLFLFLGQSLFLITSFSDFSKIRTCSSSFPILLPFHSLPDSFVQTEDMLKLPLFKNPSILYPPLVLHHRASPVPDMVLKTTGALTTSIFSPLSTHF